MPFAAHGLTEESLSNQPVEHMLSDFGSSERQKPSFSTLLRSKLEAMADGLMGNVNPDLDFSDRTLSRSQGKTQDRSSMPDVMQPKLFVQTTAEQSFKTI